MRLVHYDTVDHCSILLTFAVDAYLCHIDGSKKSGQPGKEDGAADSQSGDTMLVDTPK